MLNVKLGELYFDVYKGKLYTKHQLCEFVLKDIERLKNTKFQSEYYKNIAPKLIEAYETELEKFINGDDYLW